MTAASHQLRRIVCQKGLGRISGGAAQCPHIPPPHWPSVPGTQGRAVAFAQTARGGRPLDKTPKTFPSQVPAVAAAAIWKRSILETRAHLFKHAATHQNGFVFAQPVSWVLTRTQQRGRSSGAAAGRPLSGRPTTPQTAPQRCRIADTGRSWLGTVRTRMVQTAKSGSAGRHTILGTAREASVVFYG